MIFVFRQAESLKATLIETGRSNSDWYKWDVDGGKGDGEEGKEGQGGDAWVTRQKLEDTYKKLLLMDLEYALDKKVEQDL